MTVQILKAKQRISHVKRQPRSRNRMFLVTDRDGKWAFVAQSLPQIAKLINAMGTHEFDRVSVPSLYEAAHRNAYTKRRWRVQTLTLDETATVNAALDTTEQAVICGTAYHYTIME